MPTGLGIDLYYSVIRLLSVYFLAELFTVNGDRCTSPGVLDSDLRPDTHFEYRKAAGDLFRFKAENANFVFLVS